MYLEDVNHNPEIHESFYNIPQYLKIFEDNQKESDFSKV